jgi:hypothetical protein
LRAETWEMQKEDGSNLGLGMHAVAWHL